MNYLRVKIEDQIKVQPAPLDGSVLLLQSSTWSQTSAQVVNLLLLGDRAHLWGSWWAAGREDGGWRCQSRAGGSPCATDRGDYHYRKHWSVTPHSSEHNPPYQSFYTRRNVLNECIILSCYGIFSMFMICLIHRLWSKIKKMNFMFSVHCERSVSAIKLHFNF